ncbi:somatostatin-2-like [Pelobates fuscus]|uniref:somatostatin-2-like n=1 Tax=Pelobates fuscus TaxID=191477 RepID=UPI002FE4360B
MLLRAVGPILMLLIWSVRATSQPDEDRLRVMRVDHNQELSAMQEDLLLKLLSGWADTVESNSLEMDRGASDVVDNNVIPRSSSAKFPHILPREHDRKAPCKNFFWKTFTVC